MSMPCRITDGPQFEENAEPFEFPSGHQIWNDLPNDSADDHVRDRIFESAGRS